MTMTGNAIRESFLKFFEGKGHTRVPSSSLIPKDDPTLLFTNAGMVQFKNLFLGIEERAYKSAVTAQKCVRAGGKHNDLENVGVTARHHTFFEMLGNFSFGDYFKEETIAWAWEYLTAVMKLPKEKLWVTIYRDDDEALRIWRDKMGLAEERIVRMGEETNFWMMGDTGPCGPCSEIIYDQGKGTGCGLETCNIECECDRYLEIWNLVFTQFNRDEAGALTPLPKPNIDTGMGLERLSAVVQGVKSNYDSDLFCDIIRTIERVSGKTYRQNAEADISIRVIADHSRAITFLIGDGIRPGNEGRDYVLRRILRRAARHGKLLGLGKPFLHEVCKVVIEANREIYPDLTNKQSYIEKVVVNEEQRFIETLDAGIKILQEEVAKLRKQKEKTIPGNVVFKLYDTYGFPTDLTADIVHRDGFGIDAEGFERAMSAQREKARESWKGSGDAAVSEQYGQLSAGGISTSFTGDKGITEAESQITAILREGRSVESLATGEEGEIVTGETPFYGESGGQVGDRGVIEGKSFRFIVSDTLRPLDHLIVHKGRLESGSVKIGDSALLRVDREHRRAVAANHSATHILQAALKAVLGDHVKQSGSLVTAERLRFDFTHFSKIEDDELAKIEALANEYIRMNVEVSTNILSLEKAMESGATAVFDEKYGKHVRVVTMGDVSKELCGGTHVARTGDIGYLKIVHESAIAAGVRRIEAFTMQLAIKVASTTTTELKNAASLLKTQPFSLVERLKKVLLQQKDLEREIETLRGKLAARDSSDLLGGAKEIKGIRVLATVVDAADAKAMRDFGDKLRDRLKSGIILLGGRSGDKAMLLCMVTKDLTGRYQAGNIIKEIAPLVGGSGGGRPDMAQAGGTKPENIEQALKKLEEIL